MVEGQPREAGLLAIVVGQGIVFRVPARDVLQRDMETYGQMVQPLAHTQVQFKGQVCPFAAFVCLQLHAHLLHAGTYREVAVGVVVVYAHVYCQCHGCVASQTRDEHFHVSTARPAVGKQVTVARSDREVVGLARPRHVALLIGFVYRPVVHHLPVNGQCVALAQCSHILRTHPFAATGIRHEVKPERVVAHVGVEGRVVPSRGGNIVNQRVVDTPQCSYV